MVTFASTEAFQATRLRSVAAQKSSVWSDAGHEEAGGCGEVICLKMHPLQKGKTSIKVILQINLKLCSPIMSLTWGTGWYFSAFFKGRCVLWVRGCTGTVRWVRGTVRLGRFFFIWEGVRVRCVGFNN